MFQIRGRDRALSSAVQGRGFVAQVRDFPARGHSAQLHGLGYDDNRELCMGGGRDGV